MRTVSELLLGKKENIVHAIGPMTSVYEAMEVMAAKGIGALLVLEGEHLAGIVTERDYARKVVLRSRESRTTPVSAIMSTPVMHVGLDDTTDHCLVLMAQHQMRHLPVLKDDAIVGMVSIRDLVDEIIADRRVLIEDIEHAVEQRPGKASGPQ